MKEDKDSIKKKYRKEVGNRLAVVRQKRHKSLDEFIQEFNEEEEYNGLHIAKSTLSQYESGVREPDLMTFTAICKHLGISADTILGLNTPNCNVSLAQANLEELEEINLFQGMYESLNEEGRTLIRELIDFVYSKKRYERDLEKEMLEPNWIVQKEREDEESEKQNVELQFYDRLEESDPDKITIIKSFEDGLSQIEKWKAGYIFLTQEEYSYWKEKGQLLSFPIKFNKVYGSLKREFSLDN